MRSGVYADDPPLNRSPHRKADCLAHLRNTVKLLRTHARYHLALVSEHQANDTGPNGIPIETMWEVTGDNSVFMATRLPDKTGNLASVNLHITEPTVAGGFREYFRQMWQRIPPTHREKDDVIRWIERQISELERDIAQSPD